MKDLLGIYGTWQALKFLFIGPAILALLCVITIPCWLLWSGVQAERPEVVPDTRAGADAKGAETP